MTPVQAIAMLDRFLARDGEDITLQRPVGNNQSWVSVSCRAAVRGFQPRDLTSAPGAAIVIGDSKVILSPSQIDAAGWPGSPPPAPAPAGDQRIPIKGDRMIIAGKTRQVKGAWPTYLNGTLVRLDVQVQ